MATLKRVLPTFSFRFGGRSAGPPFRPRGSSEVDSLAYLKPSSTLIPSGVEFSSSAHMLKGGSIIKAIFQFWGCSQIIFGDHYFVQFFARSYSNLFLRKIRCHAFGKVGNSHARDFWHVNFAPLHHSNTRDYKIYALLQCVIQKRVIRLSVIGKEVAFSAISFRSRG